MMQVILENNSNKGISLNKASVFRFSGLKIKYRWFLLKKIIYSIEFVHPMKKSEAKKKFANIIIKKGNNKYAVFNSTVLDKIMFKMHSSSKMFDKNTKK